ncbi:MAG: hypothetical protein L3J52_09585, partial [Proteobacteria bacterium]|nr:hypothetical protein [Pseudomonadota bacterium]
MQYINDVKKGKLPANMKLTEFYMQSGKMLKSPSAQKNYASSNYTHAARDMVDRGINVIMQMVSVKKNSHELSYSLSCNPDLTLDILNICDKKQLEKPFVIGVVNPHLPFMGGQAEVNTDFFDVLLDDKKLYFEPFATPVQAINHTDYSIGLLTSTLLQDGGTLQVGIGSLADALVYCTKLRQQHNQDYRKLLKELAIIPKFSQIIDQIGSLETYKQGLYAASEMFVEGFAHLYDAGILKRKVYPHANIQCLINNGKLAEDLPVDVIEILLKHGVLEEVITKKQMQQMQAIGVFKSDLTMHKGFMQDAQGRKFLTNLDEAKNIEAIQKHGTGKQLLNGSVLHSAFFLGSKWFYQWLRNLSDQERTLFQMTPVSQVNELYGGEKLDRAQRIKARFINTCMKVDVLGAAASDGLNNHQIVSGVGGQYNFVAMAHALEDSRSILMLRSTHSKKGKIQSNVV